MNFRIVRDEEGRGPVARLNGRRITASWCIELKDGTLFVDGNQGLSYSTDVRVLVETGITEFPDED